MAIVLLSSQTLVQTRYCDLIGATTIVVVAQVRYATLTVSEGAGAARLDLYSALYIPQCTCSVAS